MGASEIDLRTAEIQETRRTLDQHLRELETSLRPERLVRPVVDRVRETLGLSRASFLETVRREPVPLALTGLGLGWLILRDVMHCRQAAGAAEPPEPAGTAQRVKEGVARAAGQTRERVAHTAMAAREKVSQAAHEARKAVDWVSRSFQEDPVLVGAAALAAGLIAGVAIPATRSEEEMAAPLAEAAQQAVGSALDTAKEKIERPSGSSDAETHATAPKTEPQSPSPIETGEGD
jgi:hypothetical protein